MTMTIPIELLVALLLVLVGALGGGLFALGLWVGERGRRLDAQRREGVLLVDDVEPAEVIPQGGGHPDGTQRELAQAPSTFVAETMAETGCSEDEAREEWRRLTSRALGDDSQPPEPMYG